MTEGEVEQRLREGIDLPPLEVEVADGPLSPAGLRLWVLWEGKPLHFLCEVKRDAKPKTLDLAIERMRLYATKSTGGCGGSPSVILIAPYLAPEKLQVLLESGFGGIDLCGNAALVVPGEFFFLRDGRPSRFRERRPTAAAYRGDTSLVARTLARVPAADGTGGLLVEVGRRGGRLTLGTVSKALGRLEEDRVVERVAGGGAVVRDLGLLLDRLADEAPPVRHDDEWLGRVDLGGDELLGRLARLARLARLDGGGGVRVRRTGASSVGTYAAFADAPMIECYCDVPPARVLAALEAPAEETRRFPNLRLLRTGDQRAYFDPGPALAASPVQAWLELRRGDKRQKEAAGDVRRLLLDQAAGAAKTSESLT